MLELAQTGDHALALETLTPVLAWDGLLDLPARGALHTLLAECYRALDQAEAAFPHAREAADLPVPLSLRDRHAALCAWRDAQMPGQA